MITPPNTFAKFSYYCISFWATALTLVANNPLRYTFFGHRICLQRPWVWVALPGMWVQGQRNCPSPSPCWSQDLPMESVSLSNCGNRHSEPKPSSADGSKMLGSGQPAKPKIPPCKSFALAQSFWLGNHPIERWSFQTIPAATCLADWKYFTLQLGKLVWYSSLYWAIHHSEAFVVNKGLEDNPSSYPLRNQPVQSMRNQHCLMWKH